MEIGRIEAVLSARLDRDPFEKYERLVKEADTKAKKGVTTRLDAKADVRHVDKYKRSLHDVDGQNQRTSKSTRGLTNNFRQQAGAAIKGAVAAGALFAAYKAGKDAIAVTADFAKGTLAVARATGLSNKEASAYVALTKVRDVDTKAFTMSLTLMSKQIVAANDGTEKSVKAFDALGVSQKSLKDGDVNAVFLEIADGLNAMEPGAKRNALAAQVLGKSYLKLFPLVTGGSKAIREEMALAAKYGVEIGDKGGKGFKDFAAAQREAQYAQIGLQLQLGQFLIPLVTKVRLAVAHFILEWKKPGGDFAGVKKNLERLGGALSAVATWMKDHSGLVAGMVAAWVAFKVAFAGLRLLTTFTAAMGSIKMWAELGAARGKAFGAAFQIAAVVGLAYLIYEQGKAGFDLIKGKVKDLNIFPALGPIIGKWVSGIIDPVGAEAGNFGERIKKGWLGRAFSNTWDWIKNGASDTWRKLGGIFGGGSGKLAAIKAPNLEGFSKMGQEVGRWVREAVANIGRFAAGAYTRGRELASSAVSGVASLLSGLAGRVGRWVREAVNNVGDYAGDALRKGQSVGRNILNGVSGFVNDLPGKVSGYVRRAIDGVGNLVSKATSAGASVGRAVINGIGSGLSSMGSFLSNVGQGIRNWINANTRFGDPIKIGPLTVNLPKLAKGGRVGPSLKGAQLFVAGEGGKDEWVISQEGDRQKNIGWAMDALEQLTGRKVATHKMGALIGKALGSKLKKSVGALGDYGAEAAKRGNQIDRLETQYSQKSREYDVTDEKFLTNNDDGSVTVNESQVDDRLRELGNLRKLRSDLKSAVEGLNAWISTTAATLKRAITALKKALGKAKKKDRRVYVNEIKKMETASAAMLALQPDLVSSAEDSRIDLLELDAETADVASMKSQGKPPPKKDDPPTDPTDPTDPATAPPSAEEIARAAAAQVASFTANRASLFGAFGQNFVGAGGQLTASSAAAGFRMFGAGQADSGGVFGSAGGSGFADVTGGGFGSAQRAGAGGVIITNNYAAPPPDPHTWSQGLAWEIRTAV